jgi:hypothetical protein
MSLHVILISLQAQRGIKWKLHGRSWMGLQSKRLLPFFSTVRTPAPAECGRHEGTVDSIS